MTGARRPAQVCRPGRTDRAVPAERQEAVLHPIERRTRRRALIAGAVAGGAIRTTRPSQQGNSSRHTTTTVAVDGEAARRTRTRRPPATSSSSSSKRPARFAGAGGPGRRDRTPHPVARLGRAHNDGSPPKPKSLGPPSRMAGIERRIPAGPGEWIKRSRKEVLSTRSRPRSVPRTGYANNMAGVAAAEQGPGASGAGQAGRPVLSARPGDRVRGLDEVGSETGRSANQYTGPLELGEIVPHRTAHSVLPRRRRHTFRDGKSILPDLLRQPGTDIEQIAGA